MNIQNINTTRSSRDPFVNLERELRIRNFSRKTMEAYVNCNKRFIGFAKKSPKEIKNEDIKKYLDYLVSKGQSSSSLNLAINALKFYYTQILKRRFFLILSTLRRKNIYQLFYLGVKYSR